MSDIRKAGPKSAKKAIIKALKVKQPIFLWGPPGIGKSDLIKQIGDDFYCGRINHVGRSSASDTRTGNEPA